MDKIGGASISPERLLCVRGWWARDSVSLNQSCEGHGADVEARSVYVIRIQRLNLCAYVEMVLHAKIRLLESAAYRLDISWVGK